jgi:hypothetical protein
VQGQRPSHAESWLGIHETYLQPIKKITKREMQTKRKILYGNNTVTNIIGSLSVTSSTFTRHKDIFWLPCKVNVDRSEPTYLAGSMQGRVQRGGPRFGAPSRQTEAALPMSDQSDRGPHA